MSVESTNKLLRKYENNYVPGEKRTTHKEKIHKQKQLKREKHELVDELLNETKILLLTNADKEHVHYLVNKFNDFNSLHRTASKEAIILAFIFYVAKLNNTKRQLKEYSFTKKYGLTEPVFELIMCRIVQRLLMESPIIPRNTKKYDNDILYKTGQR